MDSQPQIQQWTPEKILNVLSEHRQKLREMGVRKLGLFGSYRRGEQTPDSDMDFVVVLSRPSFSDYMDVKFFLEDFFGLEVDLVMEGGIKPALRPYILNEVIYVPGLQDLSEGHSERNPED